MLTPKYLFLISLFLHVPPSFADDVSIGRWEAACDGKGRHYTATVTPDGFMSLSHWAHDNADCSDDPITKTTIVYKKVLGKEIAHLGARELDLMVHEVFNTPLLQGLAEPLNMGHFCGISNWQEGQPTNVTGLCCKTTLESCVQFPKKGEKLFNLLAVQQDELRLGRIDEIHNGKTPTKRPIDLSARRYRRQNN